MRQRAAPPTLQMPALRMTVPAFLAWDGDGSGRRFQLVDGEVRPMSPASRIRGAIQANLAFLLVGAVRAAGLSLQVLTEAAAVVPAPAAGNVRVPDLLVAPGADRRGEQAVADPVLVVEILSPGNADLTRDNVRAYATLASVRDILVVHSDCILAEHHQRNAAGGWPAKPVAIGGGGALRLDSIGLACALAEAYAGTWLMHAR